MHLLSNISSSCQPFIHFLLITSLWFIFMLKPLCLFFFFFLLCKYCWLDRKQSTITAAQCNHRIASAIIKQLITWQITAITVRRGQTPQWEARGGAVRCGWHWGAGASANKSPISKIISVHKQIEAAGDREAFPGHSAEQINHLFSYAVWVAVAVISGRAVCLSVVVARWAPFNDCCSWEGFGCCATSF